MLRNLFFTSIGILGGLWIAWPGIVNKENFSCVSEIILKSQNEKADVRAIMAVSPKYLLRSKSNGPFDQLRVVGDACFR